MRSSFPERRQAYHVRDQKEKNGKGNAGKSFPDFTVLSRGKVSFHKIPLRSYVFLSGFDHLADSKESGSARSG